MAAGNPPESKNMGAAGPAEPKLIKLSNFRTTYPVPPIYHTGMERNATGRGHDKTEISRA